MADVRLFASAGPQRIALSIAVLIASDLLSGCSGPRPPATLAHACISYNPGRSEIVPIDGYPVSVLDRGWRDRGGGLRMDGAGVMVLRARLPLTGKISVVRMEVERAPDGQRTDQCGPEYLVVRSLSLDGEVQDSIGLEQALTALVSAAAGHLNLKPPVFAKAAGSAGAVAHPGDVAPASAGPAPLDSVETHYGEIDLGSGFANAQLGTCAGDTCSWSRVLSRSVHRSADGSSQHELTLLGGATPNGDENRAHVKWNSAPHRVSITCALSHPSVTTGDQRDDLQLDAAGSSIPGVLSGTYALYAAECHPEARDLDPDALAKRFGYHASARG